MKILIIGSRGFIGSHCFDYFSKDNEVIGCDVIIDYNTPNYIFIESVDSDFQEIFYNNKFDVCINCSGAASVPFSLNNPYHDFQLNTINVYKILECIRKFSPECRFINLSSAAVYGNPISLPIEESTTLNPISPYGMHKLMAEQICQEFNRFWGIRTCCLRIFSAYGPRLKKQLLWDIYQKIKKNDELVLYGTGNETRDFIYISDIIRIIDMVIQKAEFRGEALNIANGKQIKIKDIADIMVRTIGLKKEIIFNQQTGPGDPIYWEADIEKIKNIGYKSTVDIESGIKNYILWVKENESL